MTATKRILCPAWTILTVGLLFLLATSATAGVIIVDETFDGYEVFDTYKPSGDPVNLGVPLQSEGADYDGWMAARFEQDDEDGGIETDVGVQKVGGDGDNTPVGRVGDEAALVLRLDLTTIPDGMTTLDFDWRTFSATSGDKFVVTYYQGDGTAFQPEGLGMPNGVYDWFNDPELGNGDMSLDGGTTNLWYDTYWADNELLREGPRTTFKHEHFTLPGGDILYVAFWMDDGDMDFAKIDNVVVMIPEPSTLLLALLGLVGLTAWSRRRRR